MTTIESIVMTQESAEITHKHIYRNNDRAT
jgi:hypothetical protein